jgi:bifunctional isochorismate lyase/aryl carrier protein
MPHAVPQARWRPDPRRVAVLVHDMQRWFVDFLPDGRSPTVELIANIARIRTAAHQADVPVLFSVQPARVTRAERGLLHDLWGAGMTAADPGAADIVARLAPGPGDEVMVKHRYSAFFRTDLAARLAELGRDQLVVCGVYAHIGCLLTAADAYARDIEPFLIADATADFSLEDHRLALDYAGRTCAVTMDTAHLLARLSTHPVGGGAARPAHPATRSPAPGEPGPRAPG